ncbi:MAG: hypothetical protein WB439_10190 [Acidobacteriaceae bacterium]
MLGLSISVEDGLIQAAAPVEIIPFNASLRVKGLSIDVRPSQHISFDVALRGRFVLSSNKQTVAERGEWES